MQLNADILFYEIAEMTKAQRSGPHTEELSLRRPEFYLDGAKTFLENHCYVASADHLPSRPVLENHVVLILLGESRKTAAYQGRCCMISVTGEIEIFRLFNMVQGIFDKYDRWDEALHHCLRNCDGVPALLASSAEILGNPLGVIDRNFKYVGLTDQEVVSEFIKTSVSNNQSLEPELLKRFLNAKELTTMTAREPLILDIESYKTLNLNLFDGDAYLGCLTIWNAFRPFRPGDSVLACYLREILQQVIKQYSQENTSENAVLRQVLLDSIEGLPISYDKRRRIKTSGRVHTYVCAKMEISVSLSNLPIGYVCRHVEDAFPESIALEHTHGVVAFLDTEGIQDTLPEDLRQLAENMDLQVGLSDPFTDIFSARLYHLQAEAALSNGRLLDQAGRIHRFQQYALAELVINAPGELPLELFYFEGLRRLFQHDAESETSYIQTLRAYLDNNLSVTKTASALFVHRSTLIERLARIERDLAVDLKDPDTQLLIRILLKASELHRQIMTRSPN